MRGQDVGSMGVGELLAEIRRRLDAGLSDAGNVWFSGLCLSRRHYPIADGATKTMNGDMEHPCSEGRGC